MSRQSKKQKQKKLDPSQGIMQGIQSIHGWMSAQTKITPKRPTVKKIVESSSEEVNISLVNRPLMHLLMPGRRCRCPDKTDCCESSEAKKRAKI